MCVYGYTSFHFSARACLGVCKVVWEDGNRSANFASVQYRNSGVFGGCESIGFVHGNEVRKGMEVIILNGSARGIYICLYANGVYS